MNRSRLAALSAGAIFLVSSVFVPVVATADTGNTNTVKVLNAPSYNPQVTSGSFTVNVVANGAVAISGASSGLSFDQTKLQLVSVATPHTGVSYAGAPTPAQITTANSTGLIPNIGWFYIGGSDPANTDEPIFNATFNIIAPLDSTLTPASGPSMIDAGGAGLTVTAVSAIVHNTTAPIWTFTGAPATASVLTGTTSSSSTLTTSVSQGVPGTITFSATGLPGGVSANFGSASVTGVGVQTTSLSFTATAGATIGGPVAVTITATDSQGTPVSENQTVNLTVVGNNDFSIGAAPSSLSVNGGATSSAVTISSTVLTGTPGTINLSASGLPTGVTANFTAASVAAGSGTTVTFVTDGTAVNGASTITISGDNGTYIHTTSVSLNVIVIAGVGNNVTVNGTLDTGYLGLTCPSSLAIPLLRGNTNQINVPCFVNTNTVWTLSASDPKATNTGHMTTADATPYVMPDSMHVLARSFISGGDVFYGNNVDLANGTGTTCTGTPTQPCAPANLQALSGGTILTGTNSASTPLVLSQFVAPNTHPGSYGITVVFAAQSIF